MTRSLRSYEGEIIIDNRASGDGLFESASYTCPHCTAQVPIDPLRQRARPYCRKCDRYICENARCNAECVPLKKWIDEKREAIERATQQWRF